MGIFNPNIPGNAATADLLRTARLIGGVSFNGGANINLPGVNASGNQSTSGNAGSATRLAVARLIGGVSFDGQANIDLPGVNTAGKQNTSGNAASATRLQTARLIGGVSFDGQANINLPGVNTAGNQNTSGRAATAGDAERCFNYTQSFSGNWNTDFQNTPSGAMVLRGDLNGGTNNPGGDWWFQENYRHSNNSNLWGVQVAWGWESNANRLRSRNVSGGVFGSWVDYLNSTNYNTYSPTLAGVGAFGTWGINVTGNAATATTAAACSGNAATATKFSATVGGAPVYAARAWVNFNGAGVVSIRSSGNVSSITDNGTGDYTINFSTAMPDSNYSLVGNAQPDVQADCSVMYKEGINPFTAADARISTHRTNAGQIDPSYVTVSVFR